MLGLAPGQRVLMLLSIALQIENDYHSQFTGNYGRGDEVLVKLVDEFL